MIVHIVMFKFSDFASAPQGKALLDSMRGRIDGLLEIEVGVDECRSERALDMVLTTKFPSWDALSSYSKHPIHLEVLAGLKALGLEATKVVDYEI